MDVFSAFQEQLSVKCSENEREKNRLLKLIEELESKLKDREKELQDREYSLQVYLSPAPPVFSKNHRITEVDYHSNTNILLSQHKKSMFPLKFISWEKLTSDSSFSVPSWRTGHISTVHKKPRLWEVKLLVWSGKISPKFVKLPKNLSKTVHENQFLKSKARN